MTSFYTGGPGVTADQSEIVKRAETAADEAEGYRDEAQIAATTATNAQDYALAAADQATSAATTSEEARDAALGYRDQAATSAASAATSTTHALTSANTATQKAEEALISAAIAEGHSIDASGHSSDAEGYANTASGHAATATTQAGNASTSASEALGHSNKAQQWAEALEDIEVETGQYSALHWATKAQTIVDNFDPSSYEVPAGVVAYTATPFAPTGWLIADGSSVIRTVYADLFAAIGTTYGAGSSTTFNLPDLRGAFVRGLDLGRGLDSTPSRAIGSYQADAFQGHHHNLRTGNTSAVSVSTDRASRRYANGSLSNHQNTVQGAITDDTYGTVRVSSETRPKNVALTPIIKF